MNRNIPPRAPTKLELTSYVVTALLLLPLGVWLKANYAKDVGYYILSLGGLLY